MVARSTERSHRRGLHRETRLEAFIQTKGVVIEEILDELQMYRPQFNRYRFGLAEAREGIIIRIVKAFRRVLNEPIKANQLFYLGDDDEAR
ncbi:MAG TPA: hypothetical protein VGQ65_14150 [Thermoanaerobaculia bacterium]|jgi:hypothetical protein|nr:hypothetical protein [Thermoanaerobaculia bacterium]